MKTDTLFYNILKKLPFIFYELIGRSAEDAKNYTFYAHDVKKASFHLDGVEMVLDNKFGIEGIRLLPEIRKVKDLDIQKSIRAALRSAKNVEELRSVYQKSY